MDLVKIIFIPILGLISGLAIMSGAGGGAIYVSVLHSICNFELHIATSLSQIIMAFAGISGFYHNYKNNRLDYKLILFFAPIQMAGALIGSMINQMLSGSIILVGLIIIVCISAIKSIIKAWQLSKLEATEGTSIEATEGTSIEATEGTTPDDNLTLDAEIDVINIEIPNQVNTTDTSKYHFYIFSFWAMILIFGILLGGKNTNSLVGINTCDPVWWVLTILAIALSFISCYFSIWDRTQTVILTLVTFTAGITSGILGIGGGMIMGPILLEIGIPPKKASAENATSVLLSSSVLSIIFLASSVAPWDWGLIYGFFSLMCSFVAILLYNQFFSNKGVYLIYTLVIIMITAIGISFYNLFSKPMIFKIAPLCNQ